MPSIRTRSFAGLTVALALSSQCVCAQGPPAPEGNGSRGQLPPTSAIMSRAWGTGSVNGIYLTGKVLLDDGTPPPGAVTIERVCNGAPRAEGYTDQKGHFSFQIGQRSAVTPDASEDSSRTPTATSPDDVRAAMGPQPPQQNTTIGMQLANCDLRAVLAGYRSDSISLGSRRLLDDPDVGTIVLHRLANVEGAAVSLTSLQAPKEARRAYGKAFEDQRKNKPAEAAKELRKAVEIYPKYAAAWYELGRIQQQGADIAQARQSFANAIAADAKFIGPYLSMAALEVKAENWAALAKVAGALLRLDAVDYPVVYLYDALANLNLGQTDAAEKSARAGEKLDAAHQYPALERVLARILERKKDYAAAAAHLRGYLMLAPQAEDAAKIKKDLAELERLSGANAQARAAHE
jgi:tetratricopeptide (TPR) repeat protein